MTLQRATLSLEVGVWGFIGTVGERAVWKRFLPHKKPRPLLTDSHIRKTLVIISIIQELFPSSALSNTALLFLSGSNFLHGCCS